MFVSLTEWRCYLFATIQLEEKVREKISEEYQDKITLQAERDMFVGLVHILSPR